MIMQTCERNRLERETGPNKGLPSGAAPQHTVPEHEENFTFDLLGLFDRFLLPSSVLAHLDLNTRKLLRVCCKRLRSEVDATVTSLLVNRYNISKLATGPPGSLSRRYPRLRRLAFGANEPRDVATLLCAHLPSLAATSCLDCLDFWAYYSSISSDLWLALVQHAPVALRLRLNINESLLRRMEVEQGLAALAALRRGRPGLLVEFNTDHTFFGFRSTDPPTLRFLAAADYVRSLGFSIGLRGRELQDGDFFSHLATPEAAQAEGGQGERRGAAEVQAARDDGRGQAEAGLLASALAIEALSLTHYESEERPPVGPLLRQLHLLTALRSLTLDCEISLGELGPLTACFALTRLTVDLLTARPHVPTTAAPPPPPQLGGPTVQPPAPLKQVLSLTLGSESHPAQPLATVFPGLTELVSEPCTRKVGVYNVFSCPLMLSGGSRLTSLTIGCVVASEATAALVAATALTALAFTHSDNGSTAGLLAAAAQLPGLRRLALWDHEEADEYLSLADYLPPPPLPLPPALPSFQGSVRPCGAAGATDLTASPAFADPGSDASVGVAGGAGSALGADRGSRCSCGALSPLTQASVPMPVLTFHGLRELEVRATSPEFFQELLSALTGGLLALGAGLARARLDACYDPPLLRWEQLGELLAALGPKLRTAAVSGWATPGSEAVLLSLGSRIGRPELRMEYEYPIL